MTMTKKKLPLLVALAAFAMACADSSTPLGLAPSGPSLVVSSTTTTTPPVPFGSIELCKTSNVAGTFTFTTSTTATTGTRVDEGTPDVSITVGAGGGTVCEIVYSGNTLSNAGGSNSFTIIEDANAATLSNIDVNQYLFPGITYVALSLSDTETEATRTAVVRINSDMSRRVTFTNTTTVVTPVCTYTKGWYRNNGSGDITMVLDGRTVAQQQAIFDATPGKPGSVTFGDNNNLLNLYQQLLAALNNLDGNLTGGPASVDAAIAAAIAGTGGTGLAITTTLTDTQISALIDTLSAFNEGTLAGFPHCEDEEN
jgi:hypothetical protein